MHELSALVFKAPIMGKSSIFWFIGSRKSFTGLPAFSIISASFRVSSGPPSLQHRIAHRLHLNLKWLCVSFRSVILLFFGSKVITATISFISGIHPICEDFLLESRGQL